MLAAIKKIIKALALPGLYIGGIFAVLVTAFKEAKWGLFLLVFLIPQPNLWHKLFAYPMGKDILDLIFLAIFLGIIIQKKGFAHTQNSTFIFMLIMVSYVSLWNSSLRYSLPLPISASSSLLFDWKNHAQMIILYFFALNVVKNEEDQKKLILIMAAVLLLMTMRSFRNFTPSSAFSYDRRDPGPFWSVGLGANHYGAFLAYMGTLFLGLYFFTKEKIHKYIFLSTMWFSISALLFTYSRGAYLAILATILFFGLKKRGLLVLVFVILISWQFLLPESVVDRISMTQDSSGQIEGSAAHRVVLWEYAVDLFKENPVIGVGFRGFGINMPEGELKDTHNYYMLMLCEQGIIGFLLFLLTLIKSWHSGWMLYRISKGGFYQGLGFGFMGCVAACAISNLFGDRWSYFTLGGYFWLLWGLVDGSILLVESNKDNED